MKHKLPFLLLPALFFIAFITRAQVHVSYLWHLQQPIYWPGKSVSIPYRYQNVYESYQLKQSGKNKYSDGKSHPLNDLEQIFGKADRIAVYQYRPKDAVQSLISSYPEGGAQVNYSGCLIENVNSLGNNNKWGYSSGWANNFKTARGWKTSGGFPRLDITGFSFHHVLSPLVNENVLRKEIQAHKYIYGKNFGTSPLYSKGYWPAECAFSERIIKVLKEEGFEWTVVANSHLARTLSDYPLTFGTNGSNIDPPNKADIMTGKKGNNWWSGQIDGRGGAFASPYCYQAHYSQYIDPATGSIYKIKIVPMADLLSYQNGYGTMGTSDIDNNIAPYNDTAHNSIILLAHDGDNAWGGGYDYYNISVPGFASACKSKGYVMTTIQQFLNDHSPPATDIVHVEDGSWFNAANDWGHPQFINWLWPLYTSSYRFDSSGWTEDARNWAVLIAATNRVQMAEELTGQLDIADIVAPDANSKDAEKAWHFLLPAFTSGYMYYGTSVDMEVKQSLAANIAVSFADSVIDNFSYDSTSPTVFIPQRFPYNPGGTGFGPLYGYKQVQLSSDFHIWTFAYDVSGLKSVKLRYRVDYDGNNPLTSRQNETYTGGNEVSPWFSKEMNHRIFPKGNVTHNPQIDFFILPKYMAGLYYAEISGFTDTLIDYYVEARDSAGNVFKSPIQHVWTGSYQGGNQNEKITWKPPFPTKNDTIALTVSDAIQGAKMHWGVTVNGQQWQKPDSAYWPAGSNLFNGSGPALESAFSGPDSNKKLTITLGPFNDPGQVAEQIDFVIHYNDNSWDNNNGADYHISISKGMKLISNPVDISACENTKARLSFQAAGVKLFQWQIKNGNNWQPAGKANYYDVNTSSLWVNPVKPEDDSSFFRCMLTDYIDTIYTSVVLMTVKKAPVVSVNGIDSFYCQNSLPDTFEPSPAGGYFLNNSITGNVFNPMLPDTGLLSVIYKYTASNGCQAADTTFTYVYPVPVVSLASFAGVSIFDSSFYLTGGNPPGGTYSGDFVFNGKFYPVLADTGYHLVFYSFTDKSGCTGIDTQSIYVSPFNFLKKPEKNDYFLTYDTENKVLTIELKYSFYMNIQNSNGKRILSGDFEAGFHKIPLYRLSQGVYFVRIVTKGKIVTKKFLVK